MKYPEEGGVDKDDSRMRDSRLCGLMLKMVISPHSNRQLTQRHLDLAFAT